MWQVARVHRYRSIRGRAAERRDGGWHVALAVGMRERWPDLVFAASLALLAIAALIVFAPWRPPGFVLDSWYLLARYGRTARTRRPSTPPTAGRTGARSSRPSPGRGRAPTTPDWPRTNRPLPPPRRCN